MVVIEQLLTKQEVKEYRHTLDIAPWNDGRQTAMGMSAAVKQNSQADRQDSKVQELTNKLLAKFGSNPKLISSALPHRIFPPCFNRYRQGETYGFHVDAAIMRMPNSGEVLRSDLSMTTFLSEAEEYQGGELLIKTEYGLQTVKLNAGDAVVYPSGSLHRVTAVTKGQRIAAITWMQSLVPNTPLREILFELDQSIQALLKNSAIDRDELDRLHHIYHNLIRHNSQI